MIGLILQLVCTCGDCVCEAPQPSIPYHETCEGPQKYSNGNLWKPKGDHSGSLVVLLRTKYPIFDTCQVKLRDGSWESLEYTGLSNGDRQTYRGREPGGKYYAGKQKLGGVRCFVCPDLICLSRCEFPIPGAPKERHG